MDTIKEWIIEDIFTAIKRIGFNTEEAPLPYLHAATNVSAHLIIYNPVTVTLFELVEEYFHAKYNHSRKNKEYDIRNTNERDAHRSALDFLVNRWKYYDGSKNWLTFMTVTGTPADFEDDIVNAFYPHEDIPYSSISFG